MCDTQKLDRLECLSLLYLLVPVIVFFIGWLKLPYAMVGVAAMIIVLRPLLWAIIQKNVQKEGTRNSVEWLLVCGVALAWVFLSGLAGGLTLNQDWGLRMAVFHDLVEKPWPVIYSATTPAYQTEILRFPMGYYLVPAFLGKIASWEAAGQFLWMWTSGGVALFLGLSMQSLSAVKNPGTKWFLMLSVVLFSGMDVLGNLLCWRELPSTGEHIEWWAGTYQYSSNTTLLFWAPNHAIVGWISALIVWRHRRSGLSIPAGLLVMLATLFWSPLVTIGVTPLLLAVCWRHITTPRSLCRVLLKPEPISTLAVSTVLAIFLTFGNVDAPAQSVASSTSQWSNYIVFSILEWGAFAVLVFYINGTNSVILVAAAELLLLPLLHFGPGNDIVMRGGIPAITLLMLAVLECLVTAPRAQFVVSRLGLAALLLIGGVTPVLEMQRGILISSRAMLEKITGGMDNAEHPWHYIGNPEHSFMRYLLRI